MAAPDSLRHKCGGVLSLNILESILPLLSCPDDGEALRLIESKIMCVNCRRGFRRYHENVIDLLPSLPLPEPGGSADYSVKYHHEYERDLATCATGRPWGALDGPSESLHCHKTRQIDYVYRLLRDPELPSADTVCDLSGGAGHYTLEYASHFKYVIHCDLSADSIHWTAGAARQLGLTNVAFVRADYLRLPFRSSLERIICLDTLIRGWKHENAVLKSISSALRPGGAAIVDFHNWWHNPLRRIGLLKNNFAHNRSYRRRETLKLMEEAGVSRARYFPFFQELPSYDGLMWRVASTFLPPTRLMYRIERHAD